MGVSWIMGKYNYWEHVVNDVKDWINDNPFDISEFRDKEQAAESLFDELYEEDCITGSGDNFYASEEECEEFLCHNINLIIDSLDEFNISRRDLIDEYRGGTLARYLDCIIRLYVLPTAINDALND